MRTEDLEHLENLAAVWLKPEERGRLLGDLQAMIGLAGRLPILDAADLEATGVDTAAPATDDTGRSVNPGVSFRISIVTDNCPGWASPFFVLPGPRRDADGATP